MRPRWVRLLGEQTLWHLYLGPDVNPTATFCGRWLRGPRIVTPAEPLDGGTCRVCLDRALQLAYIQAEDFANR